MRRRFATLDVFTQTRFAGNPLAVVLEPAGLDTAAMQTIAREFALSDTVFVFPPAESSHRAKLRIFTPARERPFAGQPTVGTAVLLGCLDGGGKRDFVLGEEVGAVPCRVNADAKDSGHALFAIPRLPAPDGKPGSHEAAAGALGLALDDIGFGGLQIAGWSAGVPFIFVPLRGLEAIRPASSISPNGIRLSAASARLRPSFSARRRWTQATITTRACSRRAWASPKILRPVRGCGIRRIAGGKRRLRRWRAQPADRAGL